MSEFGKIAFYGNSGLGKFTASHNTLSGSATSGKKSRSYFTEPHRRVEDRLLRRRPGTWLVGPICQEREIQG